MDLKTLKDLEQTKGVKYNYVFVKDLREEAIKWIKEKKILPFGYFAEFFNLTAEDLK